MEEKKPFFYRLFPKGLTIIANNDFYNQTIKPIKMYEI